MDLPLGGGRGAKHQVLELLGQAEVVYGAVRSLTGVDFQSLCFIARLALSHSALPLEWRRFVPNQGGSSNCALTSIAPPPPPPPTPWLVKKTTD